MKLTTSKEHKQGSFKKKVDTIKIKVGAVTLTVALFSGILSSVLMYLKNVEKVVSVSEDVRHSIYYDNDCLDTKNYHKYKVEDLGNGLEGTVIDYDAPKIDEFITEETLKEVKYLKIDLAENEDLTIIKNIPNLNVLLIENASLLTTEDIDVLNESSIGSIILSFSINDIAKININNTILKKLENNKIILDVLPTNELEKQMVFTLLNNLPDNFEGEFVDYEKCKKYDERIDELISEIDFSEAKNESDKAMKVLEKVLTFIKYDEDIIAYFDEHIFLEEGSDAYNKISDYNDYLLSSVLESDKDETNGVCANYTALFTAMCYKLGIESYYISGSLAESEVGHAWNLIKVDNEYKYIDITGLDGSYFNSKWYEMYLLGGNKSYPKEFYWELVKGNVYLELDNNAFIPTDDIDRIKKVLEKNPEIIYYNSDIAGTYVNNEGIDPTLPIIISFGSGFIVAVVGRGVIKRKERNV